MFIGAGSEFFIEISKIINFTCLIITTYKIILKMCSNIVKSKQIT